MKTILTVEDLLFVLRENPAYRAVAFGFHDESPSVFEYHDHDPFLPEKHIANIFVTAEIKHLFDVATQADKTGEQKIGAKLRLRCGPYSSTWVLPEHPAAAKQARMP